MQTWLRMPQRTGARAIACMIAVGSAGCVTTTTVPPDELPALAESAARDPRGWHRVRDRSGKPVIVGQVESVSVPRQGAPAEEDTYEAPFSARVCDRALILANDRYGSSYPLADVDRVMVHHTEPGHRTQGGVAMIVLGALVLAPSSALVLSGAGWLASADSSGTAIGKGLLGIGLAGVAGSAALIMPGIVWVVQDRRFDRKELARPKPALELTPGGARVRVAF